MNNWRVEYSDEARDDLRGLDGSAKLQVNKAIHKVSENPLSKSEGGYGTPLGHKRGLNLTGLLKIKLKRLGIRVIYSIERKEKEMLITVIAARTDD